MRALRNAEASNQSGCLPRHLALSDYGRGGDGRGGGGGGNSNQATPCGVWNMPPNWCAMACTYLK